MACHRATPAPPRHLAARKPIPRPTPRATVAAVVATAVGLTASGAAVSVVTAPASYADDPSQPLPVITFPQRDAEEQATYDRTRTFDEMTPEEIADELALGDPGDVSTRGLKNGGPALDPAEPAAVCDDPSRVTPAAGDVVSGWRTEERPNHRGIDIAADTGSPIYTATSGVVIDSGPAEGFGLWIRVQADDGTITVYGHNDENLVEVGRHIEAGEQIATVGSRGDAQGPHLHFEVWVDGVDVDPWEWLQGASTPGACAPETSAPKVPQEEMTPPPPVGNDNQRGTAEGASGDGVNQTLGERALAIGETQIGVPYVWGGSSPEQGFDCSGLVWWSLNQAGSDLPRTTSEAMASWGVAVSLDDLRPGDLVVSNNGGHVGIYAGVVDGVPSLLNAPTFGETVKLSPVQWFLDRLTAIRRVS